MHVVICENQIKEYAGKIAVKKDQKSLSIENSRIYLLLVAHWLKYWCASPVGLGSIPCMPCLKSAITRGNLNMLLPSTNIS